MIGMPKSMMMDSELPLDAALKERSRPVLESVTLKSWFPQSSDAVIRLRPVPPEDDADGAL